MLFPMMRLSILYTSSAFQIPAYNCILLYQLSPLCHRKHASCCIIQQPSASGRSATPTSSPRVSPRASPRASPRHSPHGSPRGSPIPSRHIRQHSSPSIALQSTDAASHQGDPSYRGAAANFNHSPSRSRTHSGGEASSRLAVKSASDIAERSGPLVRSSEVVRQRPKDLRTASVSTTTSESSTPTSNNGDIKLVSWS